MKDLISLTDKIGYSTFTNKKAVILCKFEENMYFSSPTTVLVLNN